MAYLSIPSRWTRQPTYPVRVKSQYLASLRAFITPFGAEGVAPVTYGSTAHRGMAVGGLGMAFDGSTTTDQIYAAASGTVASAATFIGRFVVVGAATGGFHTLAGSMQTSTNDRRRVFLTDATSIISANSFGSSSQTAASTATWTTGVVHNAAGVFNGTTSRTVYLDGASVTNTSNCGAGGTEDKLTFGAWSGTTDTYVLNGTLFYGGWWDRAFTADEVLEFNRFPWLWAEPWKRRVYFLGPPAVGGSFQAAWASNANQVIQPGAMQ